MADRFHRLRVAILAALGWGCIERAPVRDDDAQPGGGPTDVGAPPVADDGGRADAEGADGEGADRGPEPAEQADATVSVVPACADPREVTYLGRATGVRACADETLERVAAPRCEPSVGGVACGENAGDSIGLCVGDDECTGRPHGQCRDSAFGELGCTCQYGCTGDADCQPGQTCLCAGVTNIRGDFDASATRCVPTNCSTGADCASGVCAVALWDAPCWLDVVMGCRTSADTCRTHGDCPEWHVCLPSDDGWHCTYDTYADWVCGRPLHVDAAPRTAPAANGVGWAGDVAAPAVGGDAAERAAFWLHIAALEHASVASFARFSLQLMALGAPPELLAATQQAGADEVEHARLAYGLASAYAGRPLGPGPLHLDDLRIETDRAIVVAELVREACVGETMGAADAAMAAADEPDPIVRAVWQRIAVDEQRHAALGWQTLAWLLADADASLRAVALDAFEDALARLARRPGRDEVVATVVRPAMGGLGLG